MTYAFFIVTRSETSLLIPAAFSFTAFVVIPGQIYREEPAFMSNVILQNPCYIKCTQLTLALASPKVKHKPADISVLRQLFVRNCCLSSSSHTKKYLNQNVFSLFSLAKSSRTKGMLGISILLWRQSQSRVFFSSFPYVRQDLFEGLSGMKPLSFDIDLKNLKVCDIIMRVDLIICYPAAYRHNWARI